MGQVFSGPQQDTTVRDLMVNESAAAREREAQRQAQITSGMGAINSQFGGFNDDFYNSRKTAMLDYYQPQLDDQMKKARDALTFQFARAGTLNSSMAGQRSADLTKNYDLQKASLVSNAESDAASLRNAVANQKSNLIGQLNATGDANQTADSALAATQQIYAQRPAYSPLGDIFAGVTSGIGNLVQAGQRDAYTKAYFGSGGGKGSAPDGELMGQMLIPLLGLGLTVGGATLGGLQKQWYQEELTKSEHEAYARSRAARDTELSRQQQFQQQANDEWNATKNAISPQSTELNRMDAEQRFMDTFDARGTTQPEGQYLSGQDRTTSAVKGEIAKRAATAAQDARTRVKALAKVGSFDNAMQDNGLALQQGSSLLNTLNGIRRGSMAVGGQEANIPAYQVAPGNDLLSPIMSAVGGMMTGMGSGNTGGVDLQLPFGANFTRPFIPTTAVSPKTAQSLLPTLGPSLFSGGR